MIYYTNRYLLWLLLCVLAQTSIAQKGESISQELLQATSHALYPESEAAYLHKNIAITYSLKRDGYTMTTKYNNRIKIYSDEGVERFGNFSYYLRTGSGSRSSEVLRDLKVAVYNVDGETMTSDVLNEEDVYREDYSKNIEMVKAALPNVRPGSVLDIRYEIVSPFIYTTRRHNFQEDIPVEYSRYELVKPPVLGLTPVATGTIEWEVDQRKLPLTGETLLSFVTSEVPPLRDDDYVLNIKDYWSSIRYEIHTLRRQSGSIREFSKSWEHLGKNLLKEDKLGAYLNDKIKNAKPLIEQALALPKEERIQLIYRYVTDNFAYSKDIGIYAKNKPSKVWEAKAGSVPELNILLINLLRKADIEAHPLLTKIRWSGILNPNYPSLTTLNYLLAAIPTDDSYLMLDASSKYTKVGELPIRALNYAGLLLTKPSKIIPIRNNNKQIIKEVAKLTVDLEEMALVGEGGDHLKGYAATRYRIKQDEEEDDDDKQALARDRKSEKEDGEEDVEEEQEEVNLRDDVAKYTNMSGVNDKDSDIKGTFETTMYSCIKSIGKELFIDAFVRAKFNENPFEKEDREFPAYFNTAHDLTYIYMLELPDGYTLQEMPEDLTMKTEGGKASFVYAATQADTKVSIRTHLKISDTIFLPEEYETLRRFFDAVLEKQKEKIILTKS